jgi:hypothetical protein
MAWNSPSIPHFYKWPPAYTPPMPWQTVGSSGPAEGEIIPWWLEDKSKVALYRAMGTKDFRRVSAVLVQNERGYRRSCN